MLTALGPRAVSRATGVSTDTLRHYERLGLLPGVHRTASGYRSYSPALVARVQVIQRALVIGFSLKDLQRMLAERDKGGAPCRSVRALVGERLAELTQRIEELCALRDDMARMVAEWDRRLAATPAGARAHLLDGLASRAQPASARSRRKSPMAV